MKKSILLPALLFLFQIQVFPTIIIVDQSGGGNYTTIQEGINNANNGDTVLVYPGTYYENIDYYGKNITVASLLLTTQDTIYISQTIINGNQNGSVVKFVSGEGLNSIIKGFTITNGFASYIDSIPAGGGIKCINSSPTIEKNIIKENGCDWYIDGGGIYCENSNSHILNNTISDNEGAYYGAGICIYDSSEVLIKGNVIFNNLTWSGYGIAKGGGVFCGGNMCYAVIEQNTICNNIVDFGNGGGICSNNASIVNTILWNNYPDEIAGQITITYSDVQGGWTGIGNIDADPLFADTANGDFHLTWENFPIPDDTKSPCIDAGDPASPLDPDSTIADMGAFYFDQTITSIDPPVVQGNYKLYQNYPNPFNLTTTISFSVPQTSSFVNLDIYNIKGQKIKTLRITPLDFDRDDFIYGLRNNQVVWDGKNESGESVDSGIYFYQLKFNNGYSQTKKMLLLK
ncbi:MAG: right-handed parallel beta-helix repeat-containing protein [Bacteroidales bacterium]|nr:right-handed parallel beta-helix repeat-containing protein [Bacteroidales bacterium]